MLCFKSNITNPAYLGYREFQQHLGALDCHLGPQMCPHEHHNMGQSDLLDMALLSLMTQIKRYTPLMMLENSQ